MKGQDLRSRALLLFVVAIFACAGPKMGASPEPIAASACKGVGEVTKASAGIKGAPVLLLEEDHASRAGQIQHAIALVRLHDSQGLRDIALEGYLKERPAIDTGWVAAAAGTGDTDAADRRNRVAVQLLLDGEISSAEFIKLVYDDVSLHPADTKSEYEVELDDAALRAPALFLAKIAQRSMTAEQSDKAQSLNKGSEGLSAEERQRKNAEMVAYIISTNTWTQEKARLLRPDATDISAEVMLAQMEEIEARAKKLSIGFEPGESGAMERNLRFWRMRIAASETIARSAAEVADRKGIKMVAACVGAAHTEGIVSKLTAAKRPFAVVTPLALKDHKKDGDLTEEMLARKYKGLSVYSDAVAEVLAQAFPTGLKKPEPGLQNPFTQAKAQMYMRIDEITHALVGAGGGPPDKLVGGGPPWNFPENHFNDKWVYIDPRRIERIADGGPGSPMAVLLPITLNPNDPLRRKEIWVKARPGRADVPGRERRDVETMLEKMLLIALEEVSSETGPSKAVEDKSGRVQITLDTVAAVGTTREAAKGIALKL